MMGEAELNNPFLVAQQSRSVFGLEAQFSQMERSGEFKALPGSGKPFAWNHGSTGNATHFGGDALDEWISRCPA